MLSQEINYRDRQAYYPIAAFIFGVLINNGTWHIDAGWPTEYVERCFQYMRKLKVFGGCGRGVGGVGMVVKAYITESNMVSIKVEV